MLEPAHLGDEPARPCQVGDCTIAQVAVDLDLTQTALREWVQRAARSSTARRRRTHERRA